MIADWVLKSILSKVGSYIPLSVFGRADSAINYLYAGRWMRDHDFSALHSFTQRMKLLAWLAGSLADKEVLYLEFGVWQGETVKLWSKTLKNPASRLHGFDSFEGLPESWDHKGSAVLSAGHFSTEGKPPEVPDDRVTYFKGWFEDTLPGYNFVDSPETVISMDADLYSSTSYVLTRLRPHIKVGTFVYFDEFWDRHHEMKAFEEFLAETGMRFQLLAATYGMRNVVFKRIG
jgi:hypothetical protein